MDGAGFLFSFAYPHLSLPFHVSLPLPSSPIAPPSPFSPLLSLPSFSPLLSLPSFISSPFPRFPLSLLPSFSLPSSPLLSPSPPSPSPPSPSPSPLPFSSSFPPSPSSPFPLSSSSPQTGQIIGKVTGSVKTQLIAHDKEVHDIAFTRAGTGRDLFASVGSDGSVRMFDLRYSCMSACAKCNH